MPKLFITVRPSSLFFSILVEICTINKKSSIIPLQNSDAIYGRPLVKKTLYLSSVMNGQPKTL